MPPLITLTTDFGTQDGYVGAMKGVLLRELPAATLVDLTHDIPPQDVLAGAFALAQAAPCFPPGTVHVAVVDPGVGTARRALLVEAGGQIFIGPDNGLLLLAASRMAPEPAARPARALDRLPPDWPLHPTFHGRDLFARVAARIAAGTPPETFGAHLVTPQTLELPLPTRRGAQLLGQVIHVDRFGNLVTNLSGPTGPGVTLTIGGHALPCRITYGDVARGELVAYLGSAGYLEIGLRDGSAATWLGLGRGAAVTLSISEATDR